LVIAGTDTLVGTVVDGRFEIRDKLGQGGMGSVYRAWQRSTEREIAIKLNAKGLTGDMAVERFLREAKLASQLSHPNTISVYDFGKLADGRLFIAMELLRGQTLGRTLKNEGALAFDRIIRIAIQICDALAAAHTLKIVHRDLKPDNVMLIENTADLVKVLDFGLAKRLDDKNLKGTAAGLVVGTPRYIPPEAMLTGVSYPEGDVYALGVMIGEMALGRPLWPSSQLAELVKLQMKPAEYIREIPEPLHSIVASLLDPTAGMRPTAAQLRGRLVSMQSGTMPRLRPSQPPSVMEDTAPPTVPGTPANVPNTLRGHAVNAAAKIPDTPMGRTMVHQRAKSPTANAEGSPWARPRDGAPTMNARPRTPSAQPPPAQQPKQRVVPQPAKTGRPRWMPWAAASVAMFVAAFAIAMVARSDHSPSSSTSTSSTPPQAKPVAQPVAPPDAAIAVVESIDASIATDTDTDTDHGSGSGFVNAAGSVAAKPTRPAPTTTTTRKLISSDCTVMPDTKERLECYRLYCKQTPSDPACDADDTLPAIEFTKPKPKPASRSKDDVLDPFAAQPRSTTSNTTTTKGLTQKQQVEKCKAMSGNARAACRKTFCKKYGTDPYCCDTCLERPD
jgi:serine/threonine-protein kinase